jgi:hypothetical protein
MLVKNESKASGIEVQVLLASSFTHLFKPARIASVFTHSASNLDIIAIASSIENQSVRNGTQKFVALLARLFIAIPVS